MPQLPQNRINLDAFLNECLHRKISMYACSLPETRHVNIGIQTGKDTLHYQQLSDLTGKEGFAFAAFDSEAKHPSFFIQKDISFAGSDICKASFDVLKNFTAKDHLLDEGNRLVSTAKEDYFQQIAVLLDALQQKKLKKVILSRIHVVQGKGLDKAVECFLNLNESYPNAFVFLIQIDGLGVWIGASPERLITADGNRLQTVALAGTQSLGAKSLEEIVWEQKELEEQTYVSSYIENVLEQHQLTKLTRKGPFTVQAANVVHLKTEFEIVADLNAGQRSDFVRDLHPTPAVCGVPKQEAMNLIRKIETHDREYYAGYLGEVFANGNMRLFVNLRSMKVLQDKMILYVGGGITADSIPEKEWDETCSKAQTLLNVIK